MSERKVLNVSVFTTLQDNELTTTEIVSELESSPSNGKLTSSFPPDYDPSKIKRRKGGKDPQMTIRLMAPFSMRCNKCGEYVCKSPLRS